MRRDIDSDLLHRQNRFPLDGSRIDTGALDFKAVAGVVAQQTFRHLTASRVSSAKNQDSFLVTHDRGAVSPLPPLLVAPESTSEKAGSPPLLQQIAPR